MSLLSRWNAVGLFEIPELSSARFGPDARFATILLRFHGKQLEMRSWHELLEDL
jgi:hypothetical protein